MNARIRAVLYSALALIVIVSASNVAGKLFFKRLITNEDQIDLRLNARSLAAQGKHYEAAAQLEKESDSTHSLGLLKDAATQYGLAKQTLSQIRVLDRGIGLAEEQKDTQSGIELRKQRAGLLQESKDQLATNPDLQVYVCAHNQFVTGASADTLEHAQKTLALFNPGYPLAEVGRAATLKPHAFPIIVDKFLTCEQAKPILDNVKRKFKTDPFVGQWYGRCSTVCYGMHQRFGAYVP